MRHCDQALARETSSLERCSDAGQTFRERAHRLWTVYISVSLCVCAQLSFLFGEVNMQISGILDAHVPQGFKHLIFTIFVIVFTDSFAYVEINIL